MSPAPQPVWRRWVVGALLVLALVAAVAIGDALVLVHRLPALQVRTPGSGTGQTYLILGSDSRERLSGSDRQEYADAVQSSGERADLVLVLRVPERGAPRLVSVPRDLYVGADRQQPHRLGLALQDGPQAMVDSMCLDLGIGVDHVVIADFRALIDLVDTTGPVSVTTPAPMRDRKSGLDLPAAGRVRLDGRQALAWVRSRHPELRLRGRWVPDRAGDPTRTEHTSQVLRQVGAHLGNPVSLHRAAWTVSPRLRRDSELGIRELASLARALRSAATSGVTVVPARLTDTQVPFAFATSQTQRALDGLRTSTCRPSGAFR